MTHYLLWNHSTNTMRVQTVEWLHSQAREAYTGNRPFGWVPIAAGLEQDMRAAMQNCAPTLEKRAGSIELLAEPVPVGVGYYREWVAA